jgi:hypothetical protein
MAKDIIINFEDSCAEVQSEKLAKIEISLDNDKNTNKTRFMANETAYLRIYPNGLSPTLKSTLGTVSISSKDMMMDITEEIVFTRDNSAELKYLPTNAIKYSWIGRDPNVKPQFADKTITFPKEITGVLKVSYQSKYDSIKLFSKSEGTIIVEAYTDSYYGSITVNFLGAQSTEKRDVTLTVKDACSKSIVAGAKIYVDGKYIGVTNNSGVINLGERSVGTHTIKATKEGYTDSDKDTILNDEFIVPEVTN